jgi:hypothetical protein
MTKKKSQSARAKRAEQHARQQRQRRLYYGLAIVGVLMIGALFVWIRQINQPKIEDVVLPNGLEAPPNADGKAWGPVDAAVLISEYSDFQ